MIYLLDTNVISDLIRKNPNVTQRVFQERASGNSLALCFPVYYELIRGILWKKAINQSKVLHTKIMPLLIWLPLEDGDWIQAAHFWDTATSAGRKISDIDFLVSALVYRLNATLVSSDADFDILPISRENWR